MEGWLTKILKITIFCRLKGDKVEPGTVSTGQTSL